MMSCRSIFANMKKIFQFLNEMVRDNHPRTMLSEVQLEQSFALLVLPHAYTIELTVASKHDTTLEWTINFQQFAFNKPIDLRVFKGG